MLQQNISAELLDSLVIGSQQSTIRDPLSSSYGENAVNGSNSMSGSSACKTCGEIGDPEAPGRTSKQPALPMKRGRSTTADRYLHITSQHSVVTFRKGRGIINTDKVHSDFVRPSANVCIKHRH